MQPTGHVFMVRPASFGFNEETAGSNPWQHHSTESTLQRSISEHDTLAEALRTAGVRVSVLQDDPSVLRPDAVFPNNWLSFHPDGTVILYPMMAPSRRRERRLDEALALTGVSPSRIVDLTGEEAKGRFLEGTGSLVFDHEERVAWACPSPRTDLGLAREVAALLGYRLESFRAIDARGAGVYHTNVVLALGMRFAIIGIDNVVEEDRDHVLSALSSTGREVIAVDREAISAFAGNVIELRGKVGRLLVCSESAWGALRPHRGRLGVDAVVASPVPTIEHVGGGSVRCTIAEVF